MTALDPRVTLTEAEVERLCAAECGLDFPEQTVAVVADLIAARLAPIRALADEWERAGFEIEPDQLRAALEDASAPVSAQQDSDGTGSHP